MKGRLIYIVGPSGAGKDSVIGYARERLPAGSKVVFARRTITRHGDAGGEDHVGVTGEQFESMLSSGAFAMHWRANGLAYGIGREILDWLEAERTVVVSGSRGHLPEALDGFPGLAVVQITANPETLKARLMQRGREHAGEIEARLARAADLGLLLGARAATVTNDGDLAQAGGRLLELLS